MYQYVAMILGGVLLNAFAQVLLKKGMLDIGYFEFSTHSFLPIAMKAVLSPYIVGALSSYVLSFGLWMLVLSRVEVSFAYPFLSIGYIVTAVAGYFFFSEAVTLDRIAGILFICVGIMFIARSY